VKPRAFARLALAVAGLLAGPWCYSVGVAPMSTAFTYQGRLLEGGVPASGRYDLRCGLFFAESGGSPGAPWLSNAAVTVTNGTFAAALEFGQCLLQDRSRGH
jgi:hypothetical protein